MKKTVNIAIVGCGMISKFHISAINAISDAMLAGVFDHIPELARQVASDNHTRAYDSYETLLADETIDAVSICTPSGLHATQAMQAISAGKHVLIEKPMALTLDDSDRISAQARQMGVLVGVVSQLRFSPAIKQIKQAIQDGVLGRIVAADLYMKYFRSQQYFDQNAWRGTIGMDGGGSLMNQGIHGVDLLRYVMGPMKSITAHARTLVRKIEVEDTLSAVVEYANGALGVIQAMTSVYPGFPRRLEINGESGSIILEEDTIIKWEVDGHPSTMLNGAATSQKSYSNPSEISMAGHLEQYVNFASAVLGKSDLFVNDLDGRQTLEIIINAYKSSRQKETIYFS